MRETSGAVSSAAGDRAGQAELCVLVVDDSPIDRQIVGRILQHKLQASVLYACDGGAALEALGARQPDLVLTDLKMPGMDGLALVDALCRRFPLVPTILMTAHGSEETAVRALERGAASYVPKQFLAGMLAETVQRVLSVSQTHSDQRRLHACWLQSEFHFRLDNDVGLIDPLVAELQCCGRQAGGRDENDLLRIGMALQEALTNAIHHGNLELSSELRSTDPRAYYDQARLRRGQPPYCQRRVTVTAAETPAQSRYVIRDEGPGFDTRAVICDAQSAEHLQRSWGRGLVLIRSFMDEVFFNQQGNEITLVRRRGPAGPPHPGAFGAPGPQA